MHASRLTIHVNMNVNTLLQTSILVKTIYYDKSNSENYACINWIHILEKEKENIIAIVILKSVILFQIITANISRIKEYNKIDSKLQ